MLRHLKIFVATLVFAAVVESASAFSLLGPPTSWMDDVKGYGTVEGPMNLGDEYRWNTPVVTYGFDSSFLNYFGAEGVKAIESTIKVINDLPPMSQVDMLQYPLNSTRRNYRASQLGLMDLKSYALWFMVEELCLAAPEEYVWCVRNDYHDGANPYRPWLTVIKRNFDPFTWAPSSYVNGTLYTYTIFHSDSPAPHFALTQISAPDPLAATYTTVAGGWNLITEGSFFTGLTRDDIGGLRYIYRYDNYNIEGVVNNTSLALNQTAASGTGSAWQYIGATNLIPGAIPTGSPWYPIDYTNIVFGTTNTPGVTNATAAGTNGTLVGLRPGVDKILFTRVEYDSLLGQLPVAVTNRYLDTIVTNNTTYRQVLERVINQPDIVFSAADLGVGAAGIPFYAGRTAIANTFYINNANLNGVNYSNADGPGIKPFPTTYTFSKLGPWYYNGPGYLTEATPQLKSLIWASYDGSTNEPVVYPIGTSIQAVERQVLGY